MSKPTDPAADEAARRRYGTPDARWRGPWNDTIAGILSHRSVRRFTADPVDPETLYALVAAAQSASTSSNLQSWSVIVVRDPERIARLRALAGDQEWITAAPLVLVWVADLARARRLADAAGEPFEGADYIETTVTAFVDAAIAAQTALIAAESLGLGGVFIGAVRNHPEEIAELLELPQHTIAVAGMLIGHPEPADPAGIKPRLPQGAVLHRDRYDEGALDQAIELYEDALAGYYETQGSVVSWKRTVVKRLRSGASLYGRERLREALASRGWPSR